MKTVILCGGLGTRLSEETKVIPKPMVKIGNQPILCHILDIYLRHGFKDCIWATGYKSHVIEKFFKKAIICILFEKSVWKIKVTAKTKIPSNEATIFVLKPAINKRGKKNSTAREG